MLQECQAFVSMRREKGVQCYIGMATCASLMNGMKKQTPFYQFRGNYSLVADDSLLLLFINLPGGLLSLATVLITALLCYQLSHACLLACSEPNVTWKTQPAYNSWLRAQHSCCRLCVKFDVFLTGKRQRAHPRGQHQVAASATTQNQSLLPRDR